MAVIVAKTGGGGGGKPPVEIEDGTYSLRCWKVVQREEDPTNPKLFWPAGEKFGNWQEEKDCVLLVMMVEDVLDPETAENVLLECKVTATMDEKGNLRKYVKALLGKDMERIDPKDLEGARCLGTVEHDGDWPRITNMTALPKVKAT